MSAFVDQLIVMTPAPIVELIYDLYDLATEILSRVANALGAFVDARLNSKWEVENDLRRS